MDYTTMMMMAAAVQQEEAKKERGGRVTIPCYGCAHLCASPFECVHPNSMCVRYDPIRKQPYRLPSVELCYEETELCKFYEPHEKHGAEYIAAQKKMLRAKKQKYSEDMDEAIDKFGEGSQSLDDFIAEIEELTKDIDELEGGKPDDKE